MTNLKAHYHRTIKSTEGHKISNKIRKDENGLYVIYQGMRGILKLVYRENSRISERNSQLRVRIYQVQYFEEIEAA